MVQIDKNAIKQIIKKSLPSLFALLLFVASYICYRVNLAPLISEQLQQDLQKYIGTIFVVCLAVIIQKIVDSMFNWYKDNIASQTATKLDDRLIPLFARTARIAIWVLALLVILPFYGINISALVTALGVSSLAIALAAQDTIVNIIAGFLIMIDNPFKVGDRIKLPSGEMVEVLDIGVRRSKFQSEDKAMIIVPNVDLSKNKIVNYTYTGV
ncbi:mechanosensitive ion channel family protein [Candidatus Omnitrophota bacterium]